MKLYKSVAFCIKNAILDFRNASRKIKVAVRPIGLNKQAFHLKF